jgi:SdrD B-like domain
MKVLREFFAMMLWLVVKTAMTQAAEIGDFVWDDLDRDGVQDTGEPGIPGVSVALLLQEGGYLVASTTTGVNGAYRFSNLSPGVYQVMFSLPAGYIFTVPNVGSDTTDSDADMDGMTGPIALFGEVTDLTHDAGMYLQSTPMPSLQPTAEPSLQPTPIPACPCENDWKNHNEYVNCVKKDANERFVSGAISTEQVKELVSAAKDSNCGN